MTARELHSFAEAERLRGVPPGVGGAELGAEASSSSHYVVAPSGPALAGKLKSRVVGVAVVTAVYFVVSALVQLLCGLWNERHLERNLRALAQVQAVPEITWLIDALPQLLFLPAIVLLLGSCLTGGLFATCGLMGAKAQSECCACCYCCCNACYCLFLIPAMIGAGLFLQSVRSAGDAAELWFATCDPQLCYPLGFDTPLERQIDCLAPAVWDEYRPQFSGDHLPAECPPMYLQCENEIVEAQGRRLEDPLEEPERPVTDEEELDSTPRDIRDVAGQRAALDENEVSSEEDEKEASETTQNGEESEGQEEPSDASDLPEAPEAKEAGALNAAEAPEDPEEEAPVDERGKPSAEEEGEDGEEPNEAEEAEEKTEVEEARPATPEDPEGPEGLEGPEASERDAEDEGEGEEVGERGDSTLLAFSQNIRRWVWKPKFCNDLRASIPTIFIHSNTECE